MLPEGYGIRPLTLADASALAVAYSRNRDHLAPWDPERPDSYFTVPGQTEAVTRLLEQREQGKRYPFLLWYDGRVVGQVSIDNVVRVHLQSATVGYWLDRDHLGRGLATAMVEHAVEEARGLGLHRLEAGTMLRNTASQAVLRRSGFTEYGTAERYLFIGGSWLDHVLFQLILNDAPPGNPSH